MINNTLKKLKYKNKNSYSIGTWNLKQRYTLIRKHPGTYNYKVSNCFVEKEYDPRQNKWHSNLTSLGDCPVLQMEMVREVFEKVTLEFSAERQVKRSKQSILKEINPEYLKLKLQYFDHLMRRANSLEKDSDVGKDWKQKKRVTWNEIDSIAKSMNMNLSKLWEIEKDRKAWHAALHGIAKSQTWRSKWKTIITSTT